MELKNTIGAYLDEKYMMQLATLSGAQPWCCTVYYVADKDLNIYWASLPERRHSREIAREPKVAAAIPVRHDKGEKVIGLQVEGKAEVISDPRIIEPIARKYAEKFERIDEWTYDFTRSKTAHKLYKLTPRQYVLFDEVNYPHNTRLELKI